MPNQNVKQKSLLKDPPPSKIDTKQKQKNKKKIKLGYYFEKQCDTDIFDYSHNVYRHFLQFHWVSPDFIQNSGFNEKTP